MQQTEYVKNKKEAAKVSVVRKEYFEEFSSLLVEYGKLKRDSVFVDVPCGTGEMTKTILKKSVGKKAYLIDINSEMIKVAEKFVLGQSPNSICKVGDAGDIGAIVSEKVDTVFCLNGFHIYFDRKEEFLKGVHKILKPEGIFIFDVSTQGIDDKLSKDFLKIEAEVISRLARKNGIAYTLPRWPDKRLLNTYRELVMKQGFFIEKTVTIDTWKPIDEVIKNTVSIPGRLRARLPGISDALRISMYTEATRIAKKRTGITMIKHTRVFFIAKKKK